MLILFLFRKKLFSDTKDFIHFNITLSLLLSLIIFTVGFEIRDESSVSISILDLLKTCEYYTFRWIAKHWVFYYTILFCQHFAGCSVMEFLSISCSIMPSIKGFSENGCFS